MTDISQRIAALSPHKQELLRALLHKEGVESARLPILPRPRETDSIPLSFGQERLWFLDQLDPDNPVYNEFGTFRLQGGVNVVALKRTLNEIAQRHEVLRTTFMTLEGRAVQVIAPALSLTLPLVDLQEFPDGEREAHAQQLVIEEIRRPFDLARGPLIRASVLQLGEEQHILVLTLHHSVCDGWSVGVLTREVRALYPAFCQAVSPAFCIEDPSPLPPLAIQYADFAIWQRQRLQGEVLEGQLSYWQQQLGGSPPRLELPTDYPRPAVLSHRGAKQTLHFPALLVEALKELSRREGVTLFMLLLAAFKTLLQRYTGQDDLTVGSPVAGRNRSELESLIGFFVNSLVLRTDLSGDPSFRELLSRVRQVTLGAYAHQDLPFEKLVETLQPERDRSYTPLFQIMFVFEPPFPAVDLPGLSVTPMDIDGGMTKTDLSVCLWENSEGLSGFIEYSVDLFEAATIKRMAAHWQTLLEGIVANPEQHLSVLPVLTDAERHQVLVTWNETQIHSPDYQDVCLQQLFELQVERTPDAVAVVFDEAQCTYHELNCRANQLAHYLRDLPEFGVGPEVLVGVYMERCLELVVGLLAILKAGGAYVPLDPSYPHERVAYMLADARIAVLVTQQRLVYGLPEHTAQLVCFDSDETALAGYPAQNPAPTAQADNLAYVIYTSGSTGTPKGVMNTHRGICNRLIWMQEAYQLTETDRVLHKTPISFDVSVWEFFWPLLAGAGLVVARPEGQRDSTYLVKLIAEQHVTTLHFVPAMLDVFLEAPGLETCHCLRRIICSGEVLPVELQNRFFERLDAKLYNLYGPTEAAIDVTAWECQTDDQRPSVPIGRPIANTQIYILDTSLQPVPIGVAGELHIGGVGVARGYLNQAQLTAERFIPDPFSDEAKARLYKTGDLARYLSDGNIAFLGRADQQVKLHGQRIELGEIEAVLRQHRSIGAAVVVVREDSVNEKRLVAYLVPVHELVHEPEPTISELRAFLKKKLPAYMIPSVFVTLEALPLSPSGKVDRLSLPLSSPERPESLAAFVAPRNPVEKLLAELCAQALQINQVGIHNNLFELGGTSMICLQVVAEANDAGLQLTPEMLFEYQTIAELAAVAGPLEPQQTQE